MLLVTLLAHMVTPTKSVFQLKTPVFERAFFLAIALPVEAGRSSCSPTTIGSLSRDFLPHIHHAELLFFPEHQLDRIGAHPVQLSDFFEALACVEQLFPILVASFGDLLTAETLRLALLGHIFDCDVENLRDDGIFDATS